MDHSKQKRGAMRTPYPTISFERAYNYLKRIRDAHPLTASLTRDQIVSSLGLSPASGTTHTALGALSHYGLAYKTGNQSDLRYHLTNLALKLIESQDTTDWTPLALKSATYPKTFQQLYSYYEYGALPDDIESQLIKQYPEINTKNVDNILKLFYHSMDFVSRDLPVELHKPAPSQDQYTFSLRDGGTISASEATIIKALMQYYSNSNP